ncbi:hypothetical protein M8C21_003529, partial [Ambrosia artemisiifolia]
GGVDRWPNNDDRSRWSFGDDCSVVVGLQEQQRGYNTMVVEGVKARVNKSGAWELVKKSREAFVTTCVTFSMVVVSMSSTRRVAFRVLCCFPLNWPLAMMLAYTTWKSIVMALMLCNRPASRYAPEPLSCVNCRLLWKSIVMALMLCNRTASRYAPKPLSYVNCRVLKLYVAFCLFLFDPFCSGPLSWASHSYVRSWKQVFLGSLNVVSSMGFVAILTADHDALRLAMMFAYTMRQSRYCTATGLG